MDQKRIDNFVHENPGRAFPSWRPLAPSECEAVLARLSQHASVATPLEVVRWLSDAGHVIEGVNANDETFRLSALFGALGITPSTELYFNWHRFEEIYAFAWPGVGAVFDSLWYPSADDVDILDSTCAWVVCVGHSGVVRVVHLD